MDVKGIILIGSGIMTLLISGGLFFLFKERRDAMCLIDGILCIIVSLVLICRGINSMMVFDKTQYIKDRIEYHSKCIERLREELSNDIRR